jgi:hypothetical protein
MGERRRQPSVFVLLVSQFAVVVAFVVIGALSGRRAATVWSRAAPAALGLLFGLAVPVGLSGVIIVLYPRVVRNHGWIAVTASVVRGFLLLIPYTVLAVIAYGVLGWNATGAFASAGVMTACTAVGAQLGRLGGNKLTSMLLPMLAGTALSTAWLGAGALLTAVVAGGLP